MAGGGERGPGAWAWLALAAFASLPYAMGSCVCKMDYHSSQDCTDIITFPRSVWGEEDQCTTALSDHSWVYGSGCTTGVFHAATTNCTGNSTVAVSNNECKSIGVSGGSVKLTECRDDKTAESIGTLLIIIIAIPTLICLCCLGLLIYCCCCRKREKVVVHTVTNSNVGPRGGGSTRTNSGRF